MECAGQLKPPYSGLQVGSTSENVTVTAETLNINTTEANGTQALSWTRKFADNLPLNGRSLPSLIELTPGVLPTGGEGSTDAFVVNGQLKRCSTIGRWTE